MKYFARYSIQLICSTCDKYLHSYFHLIVWNLRKREAELHQDKTWRNKLFSHDSITSVFYLKVTKCITFIWNFLDLMLREYFYDIILCKKLFEINIFICLISLVSLVDTDFSQMCIKFNFYYYELRTFKISVLLFLYITD